MSFMKGKSSNSGGVEVLGTLLQAAPRPEDYQFVHFRIEGEVARLTRELHEALRRRCVYHWIEYPSAEREMRIIMMRASGVSERAARAVVAAVGRLRREPLAKLPGIAEAVEWAEAATLLNEQGERWPEAFRRSLGVVLKDEDDLVHIAPRIEAILAEAQA